MLGEAFEIYLIVRETRWRRSRGREGAGVIASPAARFAFVVALAVCLLIGASARAADQPVGGSSAEVKPRATQAEEVIALPDIATRATEVTDLIRGSKAKLAASPGVQTISESLPATSRLIALEALNTAQLLQQKPTLDSLERQQLIWQQRQIVATSWLTTLTERASLLQSVLNRLSGLNKTWTATRTAAQTVNAPGPIFEQIDETLAAIAAAQGPFDSQLADVLDLQARVAREVAVCGSILAEIDRFQQQAVSGILTRNEAVWNAALWEVSREALPDRVRRIAKGLAQDVWDYFRDPAKRMPVHLGLLLAMTLLFRIVRRKSNEWAKTGESRSLAIQVFHSPFVAALLVTLAILTIPFLHSVPVSVREIFQILACVPIILLIRPLAGPWALRGLYALSSFFAVDTVRTAFAEGTPVDQLLFLAEALVGLVISGWLLARTWSALGEASGEAGISIVRWGAGFFVFVFALGLISGAIGYVNLASVLVSGILSAAITVPFLYASVLVVSGLVAFLLRVWPLRALRLVQHHRDILERRAHRLLLAAGLFGLVVRYLDHIGLLDPAISFVKTLLTSRMEHGAMSISMGDILMFFLTVWAAYLVSAFVRFVLEEDVYPRTSITPGRSYATSSLLHYVVLAIGFVAAIALLGVDLSKITVLAGAFSVGIGFGLQSIVNNFVSGLIVLFERPIDRGDSVEIGSLRGTVQRIGIRASVVRTSQGADIIVPNSQFISEKVTNWTHGDRSMRIELPIGVDYATPPKKAIALLEETALAHPEILRDPAPKAVFVGFGDSSINFELRAWTNEFAQATQIRTDLAAAIYEAAQEAGISFPFPQREVRLVGNPAVHPPVVSDGATAGEGLDSGARGNPLSESR